MEGRHDDTTTVAQVLARLGVGQTLRLRRAGPAGTVEVVARPDGALEVPGAVLAAATGGDGGPSVLFARHRSEELAALLVAAIDDLELVTSSIVDASGIERLLDGSGRRTDVTRDGHLDRWDLPLIDQVRRYLSQRFSVPLSDLEPLPTGGLFIRLGRVPIVIDVLHDPRRIRLTATIVQSIGHSAALDLALHRLTGAEGLVRLRHHWNRVHAVVVLPAPTFMGQHLDAALEAVDGAVMLDAADAIVAGFGGEASFRKRYLPGPNHVLGADAPAGDDTTDTAQEEDR